MSSCMVRAQRMCVIPLEACQVDHITHGLQAVQSLIRCLALHTMVGVWDMRHQDVPICMGSECKTRLRSVIRLLPTESPLSSLSCYQY